MKGLILKSTGSWYDIEHEGQILKGRLRGKFKKDELVTTNPITVGDWVSFEPEQGGNDQVLITSILPRKNYIIRQSPRKKGGFHLIASNIDLAVIMVSITRPRTSRGFIDRFLVSAEAFRIPCLLVFNKQDILDDENRELQESWIQEYRHIGYPAVKISAITGENISLLQEYLEGKTVLLSGHSGAGKSTLLNLLVPEANQKTASVSEAVDKGKHTTTFAEMFPFHGGYIIDTPGIKELALGEIASDELSHYFPEMREKLGYCRFKSCLHVSEPGCAVIEALEQGEIFFSRYDSYLSMLENHDNRR